VTTRILPEIEQVVSDPSPKTASIYMSQVSDVEGFDSLAELALDMRSCWNHGADTLWRQLDPVLWELTHNPWVVLQTVARDHFQLKLKDRAFREKVDELVRQRRQSAQAPCWFDKQPAKSDLSCVAYFSMEYMLSEALPIYSGGLGNVAGDQLKAASDLGVPVIGIGLLYQQGYFRQVIDKNGSQQTLFPITIPVNCRSLRCASRVESGCDWRSSCRASPSGYAPGKCKLAGRSFISWTAMTRQTFPFIAESPANCTAAARNCASIRKWSWASAVGAFFARLACSPKFATSMRGMPPSRCWNAPDISWKTTGQTFAVALAATRAGNLFTTHTPVAAGFDRFSPYLMEQYFGRYAREVLHISTARPAGAGARKSERLVRIFQHGLPGLRGSGAVNGVSRLHGAVSRGIFSPLFPRWPIDEVPVGHVTNGVHTPTWDSAEADDLWTKFAGKDRWMGETDNLERDIQRVTDTELWQCRTSARRSLVEYLRQRLPRQLAVSGASQEEIDRAKHVFDPNVLTIGFARRFAGYKRPTLLLRDPDRLLRIASGIRSGPCSSSLPAKRIRGTATVWRWFMSGSNSPGDRTCSRTWST
jgi:glycogen phosphorylase